MKNVTLDFTVNKAMDFVVENQDLAVMPANLAKKLLNDYAKKLVYASTYSVVDPLVNQLLNIAQSTDKTSADAVEACIEFIQERFLIEACANEDWGKFDVPKEAVDCI